MKIHRTGTVLLAAVLLSALAPRTAHSLANTPPPLAQHMAPDFTRPNLDGKPIRLSSFRGKLVLLNFWATWCGPCVAEIPRFSAWQTRFGARRFQVIGVSMDDDATPVRKFTRKYQPTYPILMGDEHLGELYGGVLSLPLTYLIGTDGRVLAVYNGQTDLNQLEARIDKLLQTSPH